MNLLLESPEERPVLFETTGIRVVRNPKNGFVVGYLHHTADPLKRSPQWRKEAMSGMTAAQVARELDMDAGAAMGERAFPEITTRRNDIIVPYPYPVFPDGQKFYGGFDYGMQNPSAFNVYTVVGGVTFQVWELYEPCKNINEFVHKMIACPYWGRIVYIAADPHIADMRFYDLQGLGNSIKRQFEERGVKNLILANNSEAAWMGMMKQHWRGEVITFKIFDCCVNTITEFTGAHYETFKGQVMTRNFKEVLADINNHSMDATKYFMLTFGDAKYQQNNVKYPKMVMKWRR